MFTSTVKKAHLVKIEAPLEPWAVDVLGHVPGLVARTSPAAVLVYEQNRNPIVVETKRYVDAGTAHTIAARHEVVHGGAAVIVVAEHSTEGAREVLDRYGIAYVDGSGNASIHMPGLIVRTGSFTADAAIAAKAVASVRLSGRAGLVAQAMILEAARRWKIIDLVDRTGVSAGLAHRVVTRLEDIGLVAAEGRGPRKLRRLSNLEGLLDLWVEQDQEPRLRRHAGYVLPARGVSLAAAASAAMEASKIDHAVTGVAAASLFDPVLTNVPVTEIRVSSSASVDRAWEALKGRRADEGANTVLLQAEGDEELRLRERRGEVSIAARTRIYLDALRDPRRGREQAEAFRPYLLARQ